MAVALARIAYTAVSRRHGPELSFASTAIIDPPAQDVVDVKDIAIETGDVKAPITDTIHLEHVQESEKDKIEVLAAEQELLSEASAHQDVFSSKPSHPIAIFPQYLTTGLTTLIIRESSIPHFSDSFSIHLADTEAPIFHIRREIPSFRHKQNLIDARTNQPIMRIRRNVGTLPRSYWFEDPEGKKICDVQGDFFVPFTGAKSRALFKNAAAGVGGRDVAETTELDMQGSYRNRHAEIKDKPTGQMVATVRCNLWNKRFLAGGRRTYVASIRAGVDMATIVGLITALDARSD